LVLKKRKEQELKEVEFEQQLLIHRPEAYKEYMRAKEERLEENLGYSEIVWKTPETVEEAQEVLSAVAEAHKNIKKDEDFDKDLELLKQFHGIDISQLGDEE
jgi:acetoin utilization deacetylase AcuC-like enzyme